jgi:3-oxoacyl-[acyl-carrier protein] reductase
VDDIEGKIALVTGASRGIGRATALALAAAGVDVAVNYRSREREAAEVVAAVEALGRRAVAIQADVSKGPEVAALVCRATDTLGPVAILVNNAGVTRPQPWAEIGEQDWAELIGQNLTSAFLVSQAVLPAMVAAGWGRVIMLSSVAAQLGGVVGPHYAASKAGMIGLMHSYAANLAHTGVTVNAVSPALIETEMLAGNLRSRRDLIPIGRFGHPDEVASVAVMLARNGYMTGQTINVNGGWYMS